MWKEVGRMFNPIVESFLEKMPSSRDLKEKQGFLWEVGPCPLRRGQRNVRRKLNFAGGVKGVIWGQTAGSLWASVSL